MRNSSAASSTTRPKVALSEDGNLAAIIVPHTDRRILQVYQVENGLLQTTLNARHTSSLHSGGNSKSATQTLDQVLFCGNHHVVALSNSFMDSSTSSRDHHHQQQQQQPSQVLIWDLSRGGVVAHSIGGDELSSSKRIYLDAATNGEHLYLLVASGSSSSRRSSASGIVGGEDDEDNGGGSVKLQIHQYDPSSGRLMRKIKCGKAASGGKDQEFGLTLLKNDTESSADGKKLLQFVVRNGNGAQGSEAFRVLDAESGSKTGRHKYREGKKLAKKDGTGGNGIMAVNNIVAVPRISTVALYCLNASKWLKAVPSTSASPQIQLWDAGSDDGSVMLLVDETLYQVSSSAGPEDVCKVTSEHAVTMIPRSTQQAAVILHNPKIGKSSHQFQLLDWSPLSSNFDDVKMIGSIPPKITLTWVTNDEEASGGIVGGKKRNVENITVLGPGQAGGESAGVSERTSKKKYGRHDDYDMDVDMTTGSDDPSMGMSIADRLKKLTEVMDTGDDEEGSGGGGGKIEGKDKPATKTTVKFSRQATTESLTQLLTQALKGGDDGLLELALAVKDRSILHQTMKGLDNYCIDVLITKLTTRLASKPQRAEELAFWLSYVLQSGRVKEMSQLQPLKNLLQERIDSFPHLLRLEGRLSMVNAGKQGKRSRSSRKRRVTAS